MSPLLRQVGVLLLFLSAAHCLPEAPNTVLVTVKLVKNGTAPAEVPLRIEFPASCSVCEIVHDSAYEKQNSRELILAMRIPRLTPIDVRVGAKGEVFRRVLLETVDLPFRKDMTGVEFTIPSQIADRVNSGEFETHLYWRGVELRFEHGDPARRSGDYASGEFPALQRRAASNLEFGLLEAIRRLGLDTYVDDENLGRLFLMGFDTNFPHGHRDFPPHFHLVLWLPSYKGTGSLVPHLYLTHAGLISHSDVGMVGWSATDPRNFEYRANETFQTMDALGRPAFSLTITPEGWLTLGRSDGASCKLQPSRIGFDSGVKIACPSFPSEEILVSDDLDQGIIREMIDHKVVATFHYDPDSGALAEP